MTRRRSTSLRRCRPASYVCATVAGGGPAPSASEPSPKTSCQRTIGALRRAVSENWTSSGAGPEPGFEVSFRAISFVAAPRRPGRELSGEGRDALPVGRAALRLRPEVVARARTALVEGRNLGGGVRLQEGAHVLDEGRIVHLVEPPFRHRERLLVRAREAVQLLETLPWRRVGEALVVDRPPFDVDVASPRVVELRRVARDARDVGSRAGSRRSGASGRGC